MNTPAADLATLLPWDSAFFGKTIARANLNRLDEAGTQALLAWCGENKVECLYFLADADDWETIHAAESNGFTLVDIRLTLSADASALPEAAPAAADVQVGPVRPEELEALRQIARVSHTDSRFYFDPGFTREAAARLYEVWIEASCQGRSEVVLVARDHSGPIGYLAGDRPDEQTGQISLIAVTRARQGQGVGHALAASFRRWLAERQTPRLRVVTQGRNVGALRFYETCGFRAEQMQLWFHRWFQAGGNAQHS